MKKIISFAVAASFAVVFSVSPLTCLAASSNDAEPKTPSFDTTQGLYVHAVTGATDTEAWQLWQCEHNKALKEVNTNVKYFFLPSSASDSSVTVYNAYDCEVSVGDYTIKPAASETLNIDLDSELNVSVGTDLYELRFMKSSAEAAIYVNNTNADKNGAELIEYLSRDKSLSAKATGAIVNSDGTINNTPIKKIKGRGNTSWARPKKSFNITYDKKVSIAGMAESKKYSICANYQDDSLSRNRILYDLSDAVGLPYASDSRYVDFYADGFYWGSYQMTEKIEVGSSCVVNDFEENDYLNEDGTIKTDFPFLCEIDPSAGGDDYYVTTNKGMKISIKAPEPEPETEAYEQVKAYVKEKFENFYTYAGSSEKNLEDVADIDSITKVFLINELGKNWDSGAASFFLVHKQDENGVYKFYGSPVWDYDNSLGNATGKESDLEKYGVTDYTQYTGWWCMYRGKNKNERSNFNTLGKLAVNSAVTNAAPKIWFQNFVPALMHFSGELYSGAANSEIYTSQHYFDLIKNSAEMNYKSGWLLRTSAWIADHSKLNKASFDLKTLSMTTDSAQTEYESNFEGMYNYTRDWMIGRAAWISEQYAQSYQPTVVTIGCVLKNETVGINDATQIQKYIAMIDKSDSYADFVGDIDGDGVLSISDATCLQKYIAKIKSGTGNAGKSAILPE